MRKKKNFYAKQLLTSKFKPKIVKPKKTILTNLHVDLDYFDLKIPNLRLYAFQCSAVEKVSLAMSLFKELKPT